MENRGVADPWWQECNLPLRAALFCDTACTASSPQISLHSSYFPHNFKLQLLYHTVPVLPRFPSWLISLFHPQYITHMFFICFGLCDPSSVSHFPLPLFFIQLVPTVLLHITSLQIKFSLFSLCFFYLISYEFPFLPGCSSLLQSSVSSHYLPHFLTLSPFLPPALSLSLVSQEVISFLTSLPTAGSSTPTSSSSLDIWFFFRRSHECCYVTASESFSQFKSLLRPSYSF